MSSKLYGTEIGGRIYVGDNKYIDNKKQQANWRKARELNNQKIINQIRQKQGVPPEPKFCQIISLDYYRRTKGQKPDA